MKHKYTTYSIAIIFIWIGFVGAISFMEAWLKFQAPGITTILGLGIGRLVFNGLNTVEITCALLVGVWLIFSQWTKSSIPYTYFFFISIFVLGIQTFWLLPALDHRAGLIIKGIDVLQSKLHLWYVLLEILKTLCLFIYGIQLIKTLTVQRSTKKGRDNEY